ncbi:MAG: helix-turn-helix domain-containing protein [Salinigranum sp.]
MEKLSDVDTDELRTALAGAESAKAAKRLMVALAYRDGVPVSTMETRYGIPRSTLYYWLDRFETYSIEDAIEDEPRPGRPPKLDESERERLREELDASPAEFGYDDSEWTPDVVRTHIEREYGISYSEGHVRRLLRQFSEKG